MADFDGVLLPHNSGWTDNFLAAAHAAGKRARDIEHKTRKVGLWRRPHATAHWQKRRHAPTATPSRPGNTTAEIGTAEQVAESLLKYRASISGFLFRGFDPPTDAVEFGRRLIPLLREGARQIDVQQQEYAA